VNDPCGNNPTPAQQRNCAAAGVPGGSYQQGINSPVLILRGGNPQLGPESGNTWTAGVLFTDAQSRYTASVDWWHVQLTNLLDFIDPFQALDLCVNSGNLDACRFVKRGESGAITYLDGLAHNLSQQTEEGVDLAAGARWRLPRGELNARVSAVRLNSVALRSFLDQMPTQLSGTYDINGDSWPRWRVQGTLDWSPGRWRVSYTTHFIHAMTECGDKNFYPFLAATDCRRIDPRLYHNLSATYGARPGWRVSFAVDNLTDTAPPRINLSGAANTDPTIYDVLGRAYTLTLTYDFR
jgi:iron complex outermembrane receptor protein